MKLNKWEVSPARSVKELMTVWNSDPNSLKNVCSDHRLHSYTRTLLGQVMLIKLILLQGRVLIKIQWKARDSVNGIYNVPESVGLIPRDLTG